MRNLAKFSLLAFLCAGAFGVDLSSVAEKIYANETGAKKSNLIHWNSGENFPSLGIGHFIWYKKDEKDKFEESFPNLVKFYKIRGARLPKILRLHSHAPWQSKTALDALKKSGDADLIELENFLYQTKNLQVEFIYERLQNSLEKMQNLSDKKKHIKSQFYRVASSPNGLYALIDYVNFKGEGIKESERYAGEGWGLMQVLECMSAQKEAMSEFRRCAKFVLKRRVANAPTNRDEARWLAGWIKRCDTYR
ncbi:hypothetical protein [Campylobacter sp. JMF_09 ED2]|uniref:hypothetical protein n=1 Tax=Campylobacter sp. JMF_09 ED2 TaxID=2983837 RepID=UPI0022EA0BD6|nr:hypothetical protein [Campylobacter sp. JMF_09 ED2]MDA3043289.1 hypothetical protein [Campylobacter sp. JMF_09 ED2]